MNPSPPHLRRLTRAAALALVVALPLLAAPSYAEVPEGWSEPAPVDGLHALLVLGGIPLGLFVLITLLVMAPSLAKGEHGGQGAGGNEWFGGPSAGANELEAPTSEPTETGGASGRW